jgi:hypothetical protein
LDNPGWREATWGKFAGDYWKAMELEIFTLESIEAWQVVDWEDEMNVINSKSCGTLCGLPSTLDSNFWHSSDDKESAVGSLVRICIY